MSLKKHSEMIHIPSEFPGFMRSAWTARRNGKKLVFYIDGPKMTTGILHKVTHMGPLGRRLRRHIYEQGDVLVASSNAFKCALEQDGIQKQIYVVPQGVDTSFFVPDEEAGGASAEAVWAFTRSKHRPAFR